MKNFTRQISQRFSILAVVLIINVGVMTACSSANNDKRVEDNSSSDSAIAVKNEPQTQQKVMSKCQLTKAPTLRGFFLGQTVEEINNRIPSFKVAYKRQKERAIDADKEVGWVFMSLGVLDQINGGSEVPSEDFEDVGLIWHFLDDKVVFLSVKYLDLDTTNLKSFLNQVIRENNLPEDDWIIGKEESADLSCNGFQISVSTHPQNGPSIMLTDTIAKAEIEKRRKQIQSGTSTASDQNSRQSVADKSWQSFWTNFRTAINKKDTQSLRKIMADNLNGGGDDVTALQWLDSMQKNNLWASYKRTVAAGTEIGECKNPCRLTKDGYLIFEYKNDGWLWTGFGGEGGQD